MVATLFAVALNFVLTATFIWPELVSPAVRLAIWIGVGAFWTFAVWGGFQELARWGGTLNETHLQALFIRAQMEYLKGHWLEAETVLREILAIDDRDADARLMLASLLRHANRAGEAMVELQALELSEMGRKWNLEIVRERQLNRTDLSSKAEGRV
jgi:hypothetical protein